MSNFLPNNEHPVERVIRVVVGVGLAVLAATGTVGWWGWLGLVPAAAGAIGSCPLYTVFGFSTCPVK